MPGVDFHENEIVELRQRLPSELERPGVLVRLILATKIAKNEKNANIILIIITILALLGSIIPFVWLQKQKAPESHVPQGSHPSLDQPNG